MKTFEEMSKIDVSKHIEKKGKFSYLSWPYAVTEFRKNCPNGTWDVTKGPVIATDQGLFVEVTVTPDIALPDLCFTQLHPILDGANKPINAPNSFQVNTSIQRCLVKAIAIATGIGLYIYAGEDLPEQDIILITPEQVDQISEMIVGSKTDLDKFKKAYKITDLKELSNVQYEDALAKLAAKIVKCDKLCTSTPIKDFDFITSTPDK